MPTRHQFVLPKTKSAEEFESMVLDCAEIIWKQKFNKFGRNGQAQHGIDLYSQDWSILIQCKNYTNENKANDLIKSIESDYNRAVNEFQDMKCYIVATSHSKDAVIQKRIRGIKSHSDSIEVGTLFWDDIEEILCCHEQLLSKYYPQMSYMPSPQIFKDNALYAKSFQETLFLHDKIDAPKVNLVNLFVMQKYKEYHALNTRQEALDNLPQRLAEFIQGEKRLLLIEGNAGSGKSSLVGWINYNAANNNDEAIDVLGSKPLITVRLRDLDRRIISENHSIVEALVKHFQVESLDALEEIIPEAVLILDGFDELCMIDNITDHEMLIWDLSRRILPKYKVIITVRPNYIKESIDIPHCTIVLQHFDREQREEWLFKYTNPEYCGQSINPDVYYYILGIDDGADSAICDTPMTLYMLAAKGTSIEIITNSWRLYHHLFYVELSETEYNKMFHDPNNNYMHNIAQYRDIVYRINEEIAYRMYCSRNNKFYLTYRELSEIVEMLSDQDSVKRGSIKKIVQQCYALCTYWKESTEEGAVEFYHNNIRDFFLCEKIYREINEVYNNARIGYIQHLDMIHILAQKFRGLFMYDSLDTMVCQFIYLRAKDNQANNRIEFSEIEKEEPVLAELFEYMLIDGTQYCGLKCKNLLQAIINILNCLVQVYRHAYEPYLRQNETIRWWSNAEIINKSEILQYVFRYIFKSVPVLLSENDALTLASKGDFSKIDFQKTDLRNIGFQKAILTDANLTDTILSGCDFSNADLRKADLTNADIHYASLKDAKLEGCHLTGADLRGTDLPDGSCSENQDEQVLKLKQLRIEKMII